MKYALLVYEDEAVYGPEKSGPVFEQCARSHTAFAQELGAARVGGTGLKGIGTATTVRTTGGRKTVHDGPFAETKEQLGGLYVIEAANLDEAIEIAKRVPFPADGSIEIRPVLGP